MSDDRRTRLRALARRHGAARRRCAPSMTNKASWIGLAIFLVVVVAAILAPLHRPS